MTLKKNGSNLDTLLERETPHKRAALENASRHFDESDTLTVNTLEAIYAQESSFGKFRRTRGMAGAAGDFQLERQTARRMGLTVSKKNDERFDIDNASAAAAKFLKTIDRLFSKKTVLSKDIVTIPVENADQRKQIALAAFNAGEGRIAKAQELAMKDGKNPAIGDDVKKYLILAGASIKQSNEAIEYVLNVLKYDADFAKESSADKGVKLGNPRRIKKLPEGGHWITLLGRHIFIEDK